jgi:uncharacterized protein
MNPLLFFLAFFGVFILLNFYISRRLISHLDVSPRIKFYFRLFLFVNLLGIIGYVLGRYVIDVPNWLYFLLSLPIGVLFLLFCTTLIYDISRVLLARIPLSKTRRNFFKKSLDISSLVAATSVSSTAILEARFVELETVNIKLQKLKQNYKVVQLSDVHIGGLIDASFIKDIVTKVNSLMPDLVVLTGDILDMDVRKIQAPLRELTHLKSKYGTYFIVGNHEYFHDIEVIIQEIKNLGIRVLENENVYIGEKGEGFNLAGVYDMFGYRAGHHFPEINRALTNTQDDSPTVLLAHQPKYIEEVTSGVDLMLSGHTHDGQLYPFKFLVGLQQPYISGLHQHNQELQIYVSKGTGFWGPPMRLGASSEVTEINLLPA